MSLLRIITTPKGKSLINLAKVSYIELTDKNITYTLSTSSGIVEQRVHTYHNTHEQAQEVFNRIVCDLDNYYERRP
jgi:hypothetical protein